MIEVAGIVHPVDDPEREGVRVHFATDGIVVCRRVPARALRGDHLFHVGEPVGEEGLLAPVEPA